jgi:heat-inducible transcriptional repressor
VRLDERKRKILVAIIDDYINTAEPVGSRTISKKYELGLSSATIRNEMADLEDMGYIAQPHTSAGRVPSDKGYRLYVDQLMPAIELSSEEIKAIKSAMEVRINELGQLLSQALEVLSRFTKYTSMAVSPQIKKSRIKTIQFVSIDMYKVLVIVVTNAGIVRNALVNLPEHISPEELTRLSNMINDKLSGLKLEQIDKKLKTEIEKMTGASAKLLTPLLDAIIDCIFKIDNPEIYLNGATNIFNYPEFRDIPKAKEFISLLDEKENLYKMLSDYNNEIGVNVKIGSENEINSIKDCTLITANYTLGDMLIGSIGIIGPTRMEYPKVISSVEFIRKNINHEIMKLFGETDDKKD